MRLPGAVSRISSRPGEAVSIPDTDITVIVGLTVSRSQVTPNTAVSRAQVSQAGPVQGDGTTAGAVADDGTEAGATTLSRSP